MKIIVTGKNITISDKIQEAIDKKFEKLGKYFTDDIQAKVVIHPEKAKVKMETTIVTKGTIFRAEDVSQDVFDCIDIDHDLKIDGKYVDVNTDFAFMLPMIQKAGRKEFIEEILYYFEPSLENNMRTGKYSKQYKAEVKKRLLEKAKERTHGKR